MNTNKHKKKLCGLCVLCGCFFVRVFKLKSTPEDLKKMEFSSSAQRLGISFTDKIRDAFRYKWIKKAGQK